MSELKRVTKLGYGVGHVLNDLCSAVWFTYLLIYFHHVLQFNNSLAGVVLLIGQVADALSTPFVGREADRTDDLPFCTHYGRKKSWHLLGTILVLAAFPFIFLGCLGCWKAEDWAQVIYYAPFVVIFQFGWAATQISHLALIPSLTQDPHDRTELNAIRYAFTVISNVVVYSVTWLVLGLDPSQQVIGPEDAQKFRIIVGIVMAIGIIFVVIFHLSVKENNDTFNLIQDSVDGPLGTIQDPELTVCAADVTTEPSVVSSICTPHYRMKISDWLTEPQFYQVALIYMGTRLFCNLTQAYIPIYLQDSLHLQQTSVAIIPLIMYISGFLTTTLMKPLNKFIGRKAAFIVGALIGSAGCLWIYFGEGEVYTKYYIYPVACLLGAGGSTMLVTSLSITADLIGPNVESGAFVYGSMSFFDKLSNGIAVMVIQTLNPCVKCCPECSGYYRTVLALCCGVAALVATIGVLTTLSTNIGHRKRKSRNADNPTVTAATLPSSTSNPTHPCMQGVGDSDSDRDGNRCLDHVTTDQQPLINSQEYQSVPQGIRNRLSSDTENIVI